MSSSELADRVVAVCLGELNESLPPAEILVQKLDLQDPIATLQETVPVDINDLDAESIAWYLQGFADPDRCHEIERGSALSSRERDEVVKRATRSDFEKGTFSAYEYFRLVDSKGRSVYFVAQANSDCGSDFPHTSHEGPLRNLPYDSGTEEQLKDGTVRNFVIYG